MTKYSVSIIPSHHCNCQKSTIYKLHPTVRVFGAGFLDVFALQHCRQALHVLQPPTLYSMSALPSLIELGPAISVTLYSADARADPGTLHAECCTATALRLTLLFRCSMCKVKFQIHFSVSHKYL